MATVAVMMNSGSQSTLDSPGRTIHQTLTTSTSESNGSIQLAISSGASGCNQNNARILNPERVMMRKRAGSLPTNVPTTPTTKICSIVIGAIVAYSRSVLNWRLNL